MNTNQELLRDQILLRDSRSEIVCAAIKFAKIAQIKEGDYISYQGDAQSPLIFLVKGQLRVSTYSEDGVEIPISVVNPHQCAGEVSILSRTPLCANVAASRDSVVGLLDRVHARELLADPDVARSLNKLLAERYVGMITARSSQSQTRARARVSAVIEAIIDDCPCNDPAASLVDMPNQNTIAAMAKVSRETVSRVISLLEKRGVIKREGKAICVRDRAALRQLASS